MKNKIMNTEKTSLEPQSPAFLVGAISGSLLSFENIFNEAKRLKENIKKLPFEISSFQYGAEWSRDSLIEEIERRKQMIISEPNGIVRETMIDNLLAGLQ
jgi:hypothetical protein